MRASCVFVCVCVRCAQEGHSNNARALHEECDLAHVVDALQVAAHFIERRAERIGVGGSQPTVREHQDGSVGAVEQRGSLARSEEGRLGQLLPPLKERVPRCRAAELRL